MKYNKDLIKFVQTQLHLTADGIPGKKTQAALSSFPSSWTVKRKIVGYVQYLCLEKGIEVGKIDGYIGPQTEYAYERLQAKLNHKEFKLWRDEEPETPTMSSSKWPNQNPQSELIKFYGKPGTNQTKVVVPYPLKIAWAPKKIVTRFTCHEKVADSIVKVLARVKDHYGDDIEDLGLDLWGGCLNVRKMRGGSKWSTHAWGIAIDWDPAHNKLRWHNNRANFAKPVYNVWWKLWEEEGWTSLGRAKNYDWMHVQAAGV